MRLPRRTALALPLLAAGRARAQEPGFPARPITLLVGFSPGGGNDIVARLLAPELSAIFGQPVAVENRTGGSGTIAMNAAARARPDGHTMVLATISNAVHAPLLLRPPPFDPGRDIQAVLLVAATPLVVTVPAASPSADLAGFIARLRAEPGRLNFASNGPGSVQHLAAELFQQATGTRMVHVPYRGSGQVMNDLITGVVDVNFDTLSSVLQHIRQGSLRGLAVSTAARSARLPEVPTIAEAAVPGFDVPVWYMLCGPAGLPAPVVARWAEALNRALAAPAIRGRISEAGFDPGGGTPAEAAALLHRDLARYAAVIAQADIRLD